MISRSLRQAVDLSLLGWQTCVVDYDVLQVDSGNRTIVITGGYVALARALWNLAENGKIPFVEIQISADKFIYSAQKAAEHQVVADNGINRFFKIQNRALLQATRLF